MWVGFYLGLYVVFMLDGWGPPPSAARQDPPPPRGGGGRTGPPPPLLVPTYPSLGDLQNKDIQHISAWKYISSFYYTNHMYTRYQITNINNNRVDNMDTPWLPSMNILPRQVIHYRLASRLIINKRTKTNNNLQRLLGSHSLVRTTLAFDNGQLF